MPPFKRLFHIVDSRLSAHGRGQYAIPDFAVWASDPDAAVDIASKIVLCDRRTSDGILWTFTGAVQDCKTFIVRMTTEEGEGHAG